VPIFEMSGKYTPQAHAAVISAGYASREAAGKELIESLGGKLLSWYWIASPDRDFVAICDVPSSDAIFVMGGIGDSSGAFVRSEAHELRTSAQAQATSGVQPKWSPPGQS
jgi:uncharacterized protein with GYD domain